MKTTGFKFLSPNLETWKITTVKKPGAEGGWLLVAHSLFLLKLQLCGSHFFVMNAILNFILNSIRSEFAQTIE